MSERTLLTPQPPTTPTAAATAASSEQEPYRYGWRYVVEYDAAGEDHWTRVPLTLADVLHPQEEDVFMPSEAHERLRNYLYNVLSALLDENAKAVILSDTNVAWDDPEIKPHRPDLAVIFEVQTKRNWSTFDVKAEGTRPALIIEITSPATRSVDFQEKYDQYEQLRVPFYVIIDAIPRRRRVTYELKGYRLTADGYVPLLLDARGWLWLEPVRAWLAVVDGAVICYDEQEQRMQSYAAEARARKNAEKRAVREAQARAAAEARTAELEARLRQLEEELRRQGNQSE